MWRSSDEVMKCAFLLSAALNQSRSNWPGWIADLHQPSGAEMLCPASQHRGARIKADVNKLY